MISTGITGTARHGTSPNSASRMRVKTLQSRAPPRARIAARAARHVRRIGRIAGRLQREIGLDRAAEVERAAVKQRPAAMPRPGPRAEIAAMRCCELGFDAAEIMLQQDVFGRDRRVGFELEKPMPVIMLQRQQRVGGR